MRRPGLAAGVAFWVASVGIALLTQCGVGEARVEGITIGVAGVIVAPAVASERRADR